MSAARKFSPMRRNDQVGSRAGAPMSIEYRPIEHLKPDPANPRLHSEKQVRQIANSIERVYPI